MVIYHMGIIQTNFHMVTYHVVEILPYGGRIPYGNLPCGQKFTIWVEKFTIWSYDMVSYHVVRSFTIWFLENTTIWALCPSIWETLVSSVLTSQLVGPCRIWTSLSRSETTANCY
jgi:hypothetical protein